MQNQQRGRLRQGLVLAHRLPFESYDFLFQGAQLTATGRSLFGFNTKGSFPADEMMGEQPAFTALSLQGFSGQAVGFMQGYQLLFCSPVLRALLAYRDRLVFVR